MVDDKASGNQERHEDLMRFWFLPIISVNLVSVMAFGQCAIRFLPHILSNVALSFAALASELSLLTVQGTWT